MATLTADPRDTRDACVAARRREFATLPTIAAEFGLSLRGVTLALERTIPKDERDSITSQTVKRRGPKRTAPRVEVPCAFCGNPIPDLLESDAKRGRRFHLECQPFWRVLKPEAEELRLEKSRKGLERSREQRRREKQKGRRLYLCEVAEQVGLSTPALLWHIRQGRLARGQDGLVAAADAATFEELLRERAGVVELGRARGAVPRSQAIDMFGGSAMRLVHRARKDGIRTFALHGRTFYMVEDIGLSRRRIRELKDSGDLRSVQALDPRYVLARDRRYVDALAARLGSRKRAEAVVRMKVSEQRQLLLSGRPSDDSASQAAAALFAAGCTPAEAAAQLGYTRQYVTKLWNGRQVTPEVEFARRRRRLLALVPQLGAWVGLREAYRALHLSVRDADTLVDVLERSGEVVRESHGRSVVVRRVSQIDA
jgi:hypothetical protein